VATARGDPVSNDFLRRPIANQTIAMSIEPTNHVAASAAGQPLALNGGPEAARAARARLLHQHDLAVSRSIESAEGIAQTDGELLRPGDRDADGRMPWRLPQLPPSTEHRAEKTIPTAPASNSEKPAHHIDLSG
jgi:hypothetical protein